MAHLEGGCQCGAVRYAVTGPVKRLLVCHCIDCQRQSSSAFGMTMVVAEADFRITRGAVKTFTSRAESGREKLGAFCPDCGSRIYHTTTFRPGMVSVKPGTLDDTGWLRPEMHVWASRRQPWVVIPEGVEVHDRQPG